MSRLLRPILLLSPLPFAGALTYAYASRKLYRDFPEVPLEQLPEGSFTRRIVDESRARGLARWGEEGKEEGKRELYAAYYNIYQTTLPRSSLEAYGAHLEQGPLPRSAYLAASYTHAFLTSGLMSLRRTLALGFGRKELAESAQGEVFDPGMEEVGLRVFSSTSSASSASLSASALPPAHQPPSSPPPGAPEQLEKTEGGTVLFWRLPSSLARASDRLASWGSPWRSMRGGWHELVVEELEFPGPPAADVGAAVSGSGSGSGSAVSSEGHPGAGEPMVRLTFASVSVYDTLGTDDRRTMPGWVRAAHGTFARALLGSARRRIERG
ncbi:hypothetical protein CALVIDRAFT_283125 [Calocera viscosa TUFC12733]|uniref:Uncharacterized protein n=1 Tax=Calocera viscosa (strain TUFC12733) TaxID=1330018 RepID=A0A167R787_CALVF|nr:hypothetical protein CALVIDRAFT_283125 [Calocera viscosa TUFC12733]